jgi:hypothetical protein
VTVRIGWIVSSVFVLLAGSGSIIFLARGRRFHGAHVVSLLLLMYGLLVLILWGTTSPYLFTTEIDMPATLKRLLLAAAGGLLAQVAIWMNRLARGQDKGRDIAPIYLDALMGILSGIAAAALVATTKETFTSISDQQAAVAGVAGGALGLSFFDVLKRFLPGFSAARDTGEPPVPSEGASTRGHCMYAGQAYSHGSNITMPSRNGSVVKYCDGRTGAWKTENN